MSPTKGFYHCFGCGEHGTAIGFLMDYDNLRVPRSRRSARGDDRPGGAAREHGRARSAADENDELYALLREADQIYRNALRDEPEAAIAYLKKRGIDGPTAGRFGDRLRAGRVGHGAAAARHVRRAHRAADAGRAV